MKGTTKSTIKILTRKQPRTINKSVESYFRDSDRKTVKKTSYSRKNECTEGQENDAECSDSGSSDEPPHLPQLAELVIVEDPGSRQHNDSNYVVLSETINESQDTSVKYAAAYSQHYGEHISVDDQDDQGYQQKLAVDSLLAVHYTVPAICVADTISLEKPTFNKGGMQTEMSTIDKQLDNILNL